MEPFRGSLAGNLISRLVGVACREGFISFMSEYCGVCGKSSKKLVVVHELYRVLVR